MPVSKGSKQFRRFQLYAALLVLDSLCLVAGFAAASLARPHIGDSPNGLVMAAMVLPIYIGVALNSNAYGYEVLANWQRGAGRTLMALMFATTAVLFIAFYARATIEFSRLVFGVGSMTAAAFIGGGRYLFSGLVPRVMGANLRSELVIVDGAEVPAMRGVRMIDAAAHGLRPDPRDPMMLDRLGTAAMGADYILVCCAPADRAAWALLLKGLSIHSNVFAPEFDEVGSSRLGRFHGMCVMQVSSGPLDLRSRIVKRATDLALTVPAIILLSPLLLVVGIAIKLDSAGPVFFRQQRLGRGNRLFSMYKFRSMRVESCDAKGDRSTARDDDRITRVGRFIRATSIDELPQLLNVLHSDMSLVGPRPHALGSLAGLELFWDVDPRYWHRHALKPGITGLAQVRGLRGATLERADLVRRLQSDLEYLDGWSLGRDLAILVATVRVLIHRNAF